MKTRLTLAAAIATSLTCGMAMAQNSDMRQQGGTYDLYAYPSGDSLFLDREVMNPGSSTYAYPANSPSTVWVAPVPSAGEPMSSTRDAYVPRFGRQNTTTNTPNPNKVQNNGVPTQYDTPQYETDYIYRTDRLAP